MRFSGLFCQVPDLQLHGHVIGQDRSFCSGPGGRGKCFFPELIVSLNQSCESCSVLQKKISFVNIIISVFFKNDQVQSSNAMEKFGCIKGLEELRGNGVEVASLTTDRHAAIKKHMRTKEPDVLHKFDVWHVAKGRSLKFSYHVNKLYCFVLSTHRQNTWGFYTGLFVHRN